MGARSSEGLSALAVALVAAVLVVPYHQHITWVGDEGILARGAMVLLRGDALYRDAWEIYPPLPFLLTAGWFKAFGLSVLAMRLLSGALLVATTTITYYVAAKVSGLRLFSAALALSWMAAASAIQNQVYHHNFTTLLTVAALWAAVSTRPGWLGLAVGAAGMTTQTRGFVLLLACLPAIWRMRRRWLVGALGLFAVPLVCLGYILAEGVAKEAWADIIVWPMEQYAAVQSLPYGTAAFGGNWLFAAIWPLAFMLAVLVVVTRRTGGAFVDCALIGLSSFVASFPRADIQHLVLPAPAVIPLVALGFSRLAQGELLKRVSTAFAVAAAIPSMVAAVVSAVMVGRLAPEPTPAGMATFAEPGVGELVRRVGALPKGEVVFFYPYMPLASFLSGREHSATTDTFVPAYQSEGEYRQACEQLARTRWVAFDRKWTDPRLLRVVFPKSPGVETPGKALLEREITATFEPVWSGGRFMLMRRRGAAVPNC